MSESKMSPDDPRLSAYAFGELSPEEAAEVAAAIKDNPALAAEVDAIRALGGELESALAAETLPATEPVNLAEPIEFPLGRRTVKRFPYFLVSGLAAAGFAVLVVVQSPDSPLVGTQEVAVAPAAQPMEMVTYDPHAPSSDRLADRSSESAEIEVSFSEVPAATDNLATPVPPPLSSATGPMVGSGKPPAGAKRMAVAPSAELTAASGRMMSLAAVEAADRGGGEGYATQEAHGWQQVSHQPLSTFGVDVDSASYANVRRFLNNGSLPPVDAVKIEELVNAFPYDYAAPEAHQDAPLRANLEVASAPWAPEHRLVRIGLKAREMTVAERSPANLVFLLDVSGSMNAPQKLPLVKDAMRLLVSQLKDEDRVAIVTYAGQSGLALPSTPVRESRKITAALAALSPSGSTHGSRGIHLAYDVAKANFVVGGINRVILCTDGDFNIGTTGLGELERLIEAKAESGVFLTALGFGSGNYQDDTLELLANHGNGAHGYIDSAREARRLLVEQVNGTLATVAQDVKIQVEFNPLQVASYRLIGYNNRRLAAEEFNDDSIDAGEIGAGHTVTALYEVIPTGAEMPNPGATIDALRYQAVPDNPPSGQHAHEMLTVKVRAQPPGGGRSALHPFPLVDGGASFAGATADFKFAAAVAGFGLKLRARPAAEQITYAQVETWGRAGIVNDPGGYRSEFLDLVHQARSLTEN